MNEQQVLPRSATSPITTETLQVGSTPRINFENLPESTRNHEQWLTEHPNQLTTPEGLQSRVQLAELLRLQHKRGEARIVARGILRDDEHNPRAHAVLGTIAVQDKQYATATEHFEQALEAKPDQQGANLFLNTSQTEIEGDIKQLEAIPQKTDGQKRKLRLLKIALDYKLHAHHTKKDDRLAEATREFILTAQRADNPFKIEYGERGLHAGKLFRDMNTWLQTDHAEPIDVSIQAKVIKALQDSLSNQTDKILTSTATPQSITAITQFVSAYPSSLYSIVNQEGYYQALLEAYNKITYKPHPLQETTTAITTDAITEELVPEILLETIVPDILTIQYDTVSGSESRNNNNGRFTLNESPLSLEHDDIYPLEKTDTRLSRAENVFAELERHTNPDDDQKEYLVARNPDAIPPVMQIGRRNTEGQAEITTIVFKDLTGYNQFLQLITEQKKSEILKLLNERTTPQEGKPEPDELDKVFNHDTSERIAPPISVNATPIQNGELIADKNDEAATQRQKLLEKYFPEFPPDNLYMVLTDWITPDQQKTIKLTIGGKIFPPRHNPDEREFYTLDAIFPQKQETDIKLLLGDLLQGGTIAANQLRAILERQLDTQANDIPEFSINNILEPKKHAKARWVLFEPAHGILKDVLRQFPETSPEKTSTEDDPSKWKERLNKKQRRVLKWIQKRPQKPPRGKKQKEHIDWVQRLIAIPSDQLQENPN